MERRSISRLFLVTLVFLVISTRSYTQVQLNKHSYFDYIGPFREGFAAVANNGKFGFINSKLQLIVPCMYGDYSNYDLASCFTQGMAIVKRGNKFGVIDTMNHVIVDFEYDWINPYNSYGLATVSANKKQGLVDKKGRLIMPLVYDETWGFREGLMQVKKDSLIGFADTTGKLVIPLLYQNGNGACSGGLMAVKLNNKWGYIDATGKTKIDFSYDVANDFSEGLAAVSLNGKSGFINKTGETIIPFEFEAGLCYEFRNGFAEVKKDNKWGYINRSGKVIIPFEYEYSGFGRSDEKLLSVYKGKRFALLDTTGKVIIEPVYEQLFRNEHGDVIAYKGTRWSTSEAEREKCGILNCKGDTIIPMEYQDLIRGNKGLYLAVLNNKTGYLDTAGNVVIPFQYDVVERMGPDIWSGRFDDDYAFASLNGIDRLIDKNGNCVLGCIEDTILSIKNEKEVIEVSGRIEHGFKEGTWMYRHENGLMKNELTYNNSQLNGSYKKWNEKGILIYEGYYINGKKNKHEIFYDSTGVMTSDQEYADNVLTGNALSSMLVNKKYENGRIKLKGKYINSTKEGNWEEGNQDSLSNYCVGRGQYKQGEKNGVWNYYNQHDSLLFIKTYKNGKEILNGPIVTTYSIYDKIYMKGHLKNERKEGIWLSYLLDGTLFKQEQYTKNVAVGESIEYFKNGSIKTIGNYQLIKVVNHSSFELVTEHTGNTAAVQFASKQSGKWIHYYPNHQVRLEETFVLEETTPEEQLFILQDKDTTGYSTFIQDYYLPSQNKTGIEKEYDESGNLKSMGSYYPVPVIHYYSTTEEAEEDPFNPGTITFYGSGEDKIEYLKDGTWQYYDHNGVLLKEEVYDKGKLK